MTENKSEHWDWSNYFDNVIDPPTRATVLRALDALGAGGGRQAIDLGAGAGNDTVHMVKAGFDVLAIDGSAEGLDRLQKRLSQVRVLEARFEHVNLEKAYWINAGYALPFCTPDVLENLWTKIDQALIPGGVFSGQFFGIDDSWNGKVDDMNFQTLQQVQTLCAGYDVLLLDEKKYEDTDAVGRPKFWHVFDVVLQKPIS